MFLLVLSHQKDYAPKGNAAKKEMHVAVIVQLNAARVKLNQKIHQNTMKMMANAFAHREIKRSIKEIAAI